MNEDERPFGDLFGDCLVAEGHCHEFMVRYITRVSLGPFGEYQIVCKHCNVRVSPEAIVEVLNYMANTLAE